MIFITSEDDLKINAGLTAMYFYSSWMPFHKKMMTMISKVEDKYKDIIFYAIDTDHFKKLCKRFEIDSIPTVIIKKDGVDVKKINGLPLTSAFKSAFADILY